MSLNIHSYLLRFGVFEVSLTGENTYRSSVSVAKMDVYGDQTLGSLSACTPPNGPKNDGARLEKVDAGL